MWTDKNNKQIRLHLEEVEFVGFSVELENNKRRKYSPSSTLGRPCHDLIQR